MVKFFITSRTTMWASYLNNKKYAKTNTKSTLRFSNTPSVWVLVLFFENRRVGYFKKRNIKYFYFRKSQLYDFPKNAKKTKAKTTFPNRRVENVLRSLSNADHKVLGRPSGAARRFITYVLLPA